MATRRIAILGGGAMGTACATVLAENDEVRPVLWVREPELADAMQTSRRNERYLPDVPIPDVVEITSDRAAAVADVAMLVAAVPSQFLSATMKPFAELVSPECPIVSVIKGIEIGTFRRPTEILLQVLGERPVASMCGPSHAEEVGLRLPASVVVAASDDQFAAQVQQDFTTDRFRVYTNPDLVGVEFAGALKNVIAIAAGISDGLGYGDNAKSALITRGLVEIGRFGQSLGADPETFAGLAGIGDLMTTCFSRHSRNRGFGERIGRGETLQQILDSTPKVAEGVPTTRSVHELAVSRGIDLPITREIAAMLFEGKSPLEATDALMNRPVGSE
ncbi:NAD(P)H-dependent glycerol-3-phosphate dehydrogenase [Stratiformator vulcanicus]|uniref:Glycerol-3-phosphate dehydrogenase [NAD(P)+] n=1 Tax=Stratiformator vulcanicus TaxID=2527980 RepID=A0A517QXQ7_9PLAN|nr:NAD(P)H-dependent glycerol-3-phosphate dehydrogenase [Stratiformator vulcanicus]QDT36387.1 Glycerol-3-phosphate dehydrogenase [NAD(P)+] [Stratiformator vulcanicus]